MFISFAPIYSKSPLNNWDNTWRTKYFYKFSSKYFSESLKSFLTDQFIYQKVWLNKLTSANETEICGR